jgi:Ca2+-binding RTX toxin-like protein
VDFTTGKAFGIGGTFTNITKVIGSQSSSDTIVGPDAQWNITAPNAGTVNNIAFSSFENLTGPAGPDTFSFYPGGSISGNIDGGAGNNTLDYSNLSTPVSLDPTHGTATGIGGTFSNITGFTGGSGQNNVVGPDAPTNYTVFGHNQVSFAGFSFSNFQNINAGSFPDTFSFLTGGSLDGKIDGGAGINLLSYAGYVGDVIVNLQLHTASAVAGGIFNIRNVIGAAGNSLLVGDANDNTLTGGTGRNILIGSAGADSLSGGGGDNILIGDSTVYDANATALAAIFKEWCRTDLSFEKRIADLISTSGNQGYNGIYNLGKSSILSDVSIDALIGTSGLDWFFGTKKQDAETGVSAGDHVAQV